jgi:hypothetical protein
MLMPVGASAQGSKFSVSRLGLFEADEGEARVFLSVVGFILRVMAHGNIAAGETKLA